MEVWVGRYALPAVLGAWLLVGCHPWVEDVEDGLRHLSDVRTTNRRGRLELEIPVEQGETAMLITVDPDSPDRGVFLQARAPGGDVVYDVDEEWEIGLLKTGARYVTSVVSLNWPVIPGDRGLDAGTWKVDVATVDTAGDYAGGRDVALDVLLKQDGDFTEGTVVASIVLVGAAGGDPELERALGLAVGIWEELYAVVGIELVTEFSSAPGIATLPAPGEGGGDSYIALTATTPLRTVDVLVVPELEDAEGIYGQAGGIPGALVPTQRSGVAVSALTNSGPDLVFDDEEVRLLAETMAHEVLHYLGLFHPVEPSWEMWDALDDTPQCTEERDCIDLLGRNLMFPYPVCSQLSCLPQDQLTDAQGGVAHRYVAVE